MLSSKLNALVSATNQKTVATTFTTYHGVRANVAPALTSPTPASVWRMNLTWGRSYPTPQTRPPANMKRPQTTTAAPRRDAPAPPPHLPPDPDRAPQPPPPPGAASTTAPPPTKAVGRWSQRSAAGAA